MALMPVSESVNVPPGMDFKFMGIRGLGDDFSDMAGGYGNYDLGVQDYNQYNGGITSTPGFYGTVVGTVDQGSGKWLDFATAIAKSSAGIASQIINQPSNLPPGYYAQKDARGNTVIYRQPEGTSQNIFGASNISGQANVGVGGISTTTLVMFAALGLAAVVLVGKR